MNQNNLDYLVLVLPFLAVGVLFLLYWWLSRKTKPTIKQRPLVKVIRWAARVVGMGGTLFYLLCLYAAWAFSAFGNYPYIHSTVGIFLAVTAVIALIGCIISWWREWLAGVLLIISWLPPLGLVICKIVMGRYAGDVDDWLGYASALPFAGVLFILSWWLTRRINTTAPPPSHIK